MSAVADVLVRFGTELSASGAAQVGERFTDQVDADRLIKERPEAFLFGVLFTQGIRAEAAWAGPYLLKERLGHLDLGLIMSDPASVRRAVQQRPMLHRFKEALPKWIVSASRRLLEEYGGEASGLWREGSSSAQVRDRLLEFDGIGPKKAAMAVEILIRHFRVPLVDREQGQVAYDVHVRRVFLRSGLATTDTVREIVAAARRANPRAPGLLDLPAWLIGREYCRPSEPLCGECPLGRVCAKRTWIDPRGVGARRVQSSERKTKPESTFG